MTTTTPPILESGVYATDGVAKHVSTWEVYLWAMLHSAEFKLCYINLPIEIRFAWEKTYKGHALKTALIFNTLFVYVPWEVRVAYCRAHRLVPEYDDIPF